MKRQPTVRYLVATLLTLGLGLSLTACEVAERSARRDAMPDTDSTEQIHSGEWLPEVGPDLDAVDVPANDELPDLPKPPLDLHGADELPNLLPDDPATDDSRVDHDADDEVADDEIVGPDCVRYVKPDGQPDGDATSWQTAANRIQVGIEAAFEAAQQGDGTCDVWVAQGTYPIYQSAPTDTVRLLSGVGLYGGFMGDETAREQRDWQAFPTILDGRNNGQGAVEHVVTGSGSFVLDGFSIVHGGLPYPESCYPWMCGPEATGEYDGGGLYLADSTAVVANCLFEDNYATCSGGAVHSSQSVLTIANCLFHDNLAAIKAGALFVSGGEVTLQQSDFDQNGAFYGSYDPCGDSGNSGAVESRNAQLTIRECRFTGNDALYTAGALTADTATIIDSVFSDNQAWESACGGLRISGGTIERCDISGNSSRNRGGGICADGVVEIRDSTVVNNESSESGGGISGSATIRNSIIANNRVHIGGFGGGMAMLSLQLENSIVHDNLASDGSGLYADSATIRNSTFVNNRDGCGAHIRAGSVRNSVFYRRAPQPPEDWICARELDQAPEVTYSVVEGDDIVGEGNVVANPLFVSIENDDFRLQPGSLGIDAGNGTAAPATDKDGNPRFDDPATPNTGSGSPPYSDMGAYEYRPAR